MLLVSGGGGLYDTYWPLLILHAVNCQLCLQCLLIVITSKARLKVDLQSVQLGCGTVMEACVVFTQGATDPSGSVSSVLARTHGCRAVTRASTDSTCLRTKATSSSSKK